MRVASPHVESETTVTNFVPNPDDPDDYEMSECTTDEEDEIDWDEVVAAIEEDSDSEELAFNSADYPTEVEAMVALPLWTLHWMPRAKRDIKEELNFIRR